MTVLNYQRYLEELITEIGYEPSLFDLSKDEDWELILGCAAALKRIKTAIVTARPEESGAIFICGASTEKDETGFPENLLVCIEFGSDVVTQYKKVS